MNANSNSHDGAAARRRIAARDTAMSTALRMATAGDAELERPPYRVNPCVGLEMCRCVRSGFFVAAMLAMLAVGVGAVYVALYPAARLTIALGGPAMHWFWPATLAILMVLPVQAFMDIREEMVGGRMELLGMTKLDTHDAAIGKWTALALEVAMLCGVLMPCLCMFYYLTGVVTTPLGLLVAMFLWTITANAGAMVLATCRHVEEYVATVGPSVILLFFAFAVTTSPAFSLGQVIVASGVLGFLYVCYALNAAAAGLAGKSVLAETPVPDASRAPAHNAALAKEIGSR
ncbi:hypothetical protein DB346_16225 [Verrucomicrobia bacterium LW23]|nr:hypothetical protein DB346_16225 [Verrucomicrobia bacterium LW23]